MGRMRRLLAGVAVAAVGLNRADVLQRKGRYPACAEICPVGARKFGNLLDPESEIRKVDNQGVIHSESPDPLPSWLLMPAEQAARAIVRAVARGKREAVITFHGKLAVFGARHFSGLLAWIKRLGLKSRSQPSAGQRR